MDVPLSLSRNISPPRPLKRRKTSGLLPSVVMPIPLLSIEPTLAAVEAGKAKIDDHLTYFSIYLARVARQTTSSIPRLSIKEFSAVISISMATTSSSTNTITQKLECIMTCACNSQNQAACHSLCPKGYQVIRTPEVSDAWLSKRECIITGTT
jgi:hypothetical protein